jgi:hypothetical protein
VARHPLWQSRDRARGNGLALRDVRHARASVPQAFDTLPQHLVGAPERHAREELAVREVPEAIGVSRHAHQTLGARVVRATSSYEIGHLLKSPGPKRRLCPAQHNERPPTARSSP